MMPRFKSAAVVSSPIQTHYAVALFYNNTGTPRRGRRNRAPTSWPRAHPGKRRKRTKSQSLLIRPVGPRPVSG